MEECSQWQDCESRCIGGEKLSDDYELTHLNQFVSMYLDYAERQARKHIPMTMEDWAKKLDVFLQLNDEVILRHKGQVTAEIAKTFAESEFDKYRVLQDRLFESDFDRVIKQLSENPNKK